MQNFFLNPAIRPHPNGLLAYDNLIATTIPECQKAGINIIFVNWGLTDDDVATLPPMIYRSFSKDVVDVMPVGIAPQSQQHSNPSALGDARKVYIGVGEDLGNVDIKISRAQLRSSASSSTDSDEGGRITVPAGRLLMRGSWNAMLYGELERVYRQMHIKPDPPSPYASAPEPGKPGEREKLAKAYLVHKNRLSGLWGQTTPLEELLHTLGVKTLLFAGVNTDQYVPPLVPLRYPKNLPVCGSPCLVFRLDVSQGRWGTHFLEVSTVF